MAVEHDEAKRAKKLRRIFDGLRFAEKIIYRPLFPYKKHGNLKRYNNGSLIIIGNHYSIWDVVPAAMTTDRAVHYMAKSELLNVKIFGWKFGEAAMRWLECIPVKRDGTDVQAIKTALRYLKNGEVVNIFPEGTRNHSYEEFLPFHGGAAALAIKTQTPVIPVVEVERIRFLHKVDVIYGDPIYLNKYYGKRLTAEELDRIDAWLREVMMNMRQAFIDKYNPVLKPLKPKKEKNK